MHAEDDLILMSQIAGGNMDAYRTVLGLYMTPIYKFSYSILQDQGMAEDVTQETCIRLWNNASKWNPSGRIKSWLFRIAHNLCIDEIRRSRPHSDINELSEVIASNEKSAFDEMHESDVSRTIREALMKIPVRQRTALMLVHYTDCSNIEAANIMEISVDAVESLLARGRQALKNSLKDQKEKIWE
ncbi:MAG: hypothetical protein AUJ12_05640 [Alphaproteobacteria bacterium CG1_02_46_17]|nr:MAG: hypothetical protein AUJ12_05640 [Alphaproteobacteria bacterium CG1_02_46_17]